MHLAFDDDLLALRDGVAAYLAEQCPPHVVRAAWDAGGLAGARPLWSGLADMGVLGMLASEAAGGLATDEVALAVVLAETGRFAAPLPLVETAAIAVPLLAGSGDPKGILSGVVRGEVLVSVASGPGAPAAGDAEWFIIGPDPVLFTRQAVELRALTSVDRTRDLASVSPRRPGTPLVSGAIPMADRGALGLAAQLIGLGRGMLDQTVTYVKARQQFGVPVGSFQAVKHRLADALLGLELAAPAVWAAAYRVAHSEADVATSVSLAKALASDAASRCARAALQCHGAMGYTDDHHLHLWLKRTWCLAAAYGSAAWHRDRIGAVLGL